MSDNTATASKTSETAAAADDHGGQQHPLGVYFQVWLYLFILSLFSYLVDYYQLQGLLRWFLILVFMFLKAGLIIAVFMHMVWERLALIYAVLIPTIALMALLVFMVIESDYTFWTRIIFFGVNSEPSGGGH